MKVLPLTVLFYEGPIARGYLAMLRASDFRVKKIFRMIPRPGGLTKILPASARIAMSGARQFHAAHYWPAKLPALFPGLYREMSTGISRAFHLKDGFINEIRRNDGLDAYSDRVVPVETAGIRDPKLVQVLGAEPTSLVLFTGGGLVPRSLLELPNIRVLHVHPGHLPDVRGGDGLLWSMLVRGQPGASAFVMKPGIDEGDLVMVQDFEPLTFAIPEEETPDDQSLYRMIFSYYDPVLRAELLSRIVAANSDLTRVTGAPQDLTLGRTYHFLEARLRHLALKTIFT